MALNPQHIIDDIVALTTNKHICIAYSGGVDSHVLLHILATSQHPDLQSLSAIHIDHGLNEKSKQWTQHCAAIANDLKLDLSCITVEVNAIKEVGMEAAARRARYEAFQNTRSENDVLLTAQHQHDQAETLLLQLLRGAGPKGLAAMAKQSTLGTTQLIRPLLAVSQADILAYAKQHKLKWIEDPSNSETQWSRNYLRHTIWPSIEQRWPSAATTLSRSAEHCAEASELMAELAQQDLDLLGIETQSPNIAISPLLTLSPARLRNALRHIIECKQLPLPSTACLQKLIDEVCLAKQDSSPILTWTGVEVRRYQDNLYITSPLEMHDETQQISCQSLETITLPTKQILHWQASEKGLSKSLILSGIELGFRQGGEKIQPQDHAHHKTLKHLFQEWQIPPWQRDRIPLIFKDDELIAVVGYCISDSVVNGKEKERYIPVAT